MRVYGDIYIDAIHHQSCCEDVYADFSALEDTDFQQQMNKIKPTFEQVVSSIEKLDYGFRVMGYFIPCYNIQNGYYSNNLELQITENNKKFELDISDCESGTRD
jgi:hypothetical protein